MKEKDWRRMIERQCQSGRSIASYCREIGVSANRFYYWREKLGAGRGQSESSGCFLPVRASVPIEVVIGEVVVRIPAGSDMQEVKRLIEGLRC